ncbi:hypothetical protein HYO65_gp286 [Tenacibaculum phage PTm1]|uniref:Uncharacterized protein n=2 Tax=Shirahamavirus PTm1 TaxID=2846435 RepID=A0A5S9BZA0_9CAUD|nr:hypothetical protein HYO65_gp286 [Tenacibaculum phage PTm1]BBI90678.1 hypothetical protein [Tenacibaculum phage PTm1]BBI90985.1 hypothetical protein [Tenacibaculum phage PTm5]
MNNQNELIDQIDYFPFLRAFWSTDGTYERLTNRAKQAHIRNLWQLLSRDQPQIMQMLNKEYNVAVMDAIHEASKHANRQPQYCYIKARPKNSKTLDRIKKFSPWVVNEFRTSNNLDLKDYEFFCDIEPDLVIASMDAIEKTLQQVKKPKKTKR